MEEAGDYTIDKTTIDSLSSDTRILILSSLRERKKTNAELAKELSLTPPTIHHHLEVLEMADLVIPAKNDHKWIYYELTPFGYALLDPEKKMRVSVILSSIMTVVLALVIVYTYFTMPSLDIRPWVPGTGDPFLTLFAIAIFAVIVQAVILFHMLYKGKPRGP